MSVYGDIGTYLAAVWEHWKLLAGGCALIVLLGLWERHKEKTLDWKLYLILLGLLFVWACFLAWRDERNDRRKANETNTELVKRLDSLSSPDFHGTIQEVNWHPIPKGIVPRKENGIALLLTIEVRNLGAESIVDGYAVTVSISGHRTLGILQMIPQTLTASGETGTKVYYGKDAMYNKTTRILHNDKAVGTLWAWFVGATESSLDPLSVEVSFKDINGKLYTAVPGPTTGDSSTKYYPGLSISP
jgi:hypothetical protein